tara:strand:- start:1364 stop:1477 length:114 start_codon:yes stop_codon:yes gene_type:complete
MVKKEILDKLNQGEIAVPGYGLESDEIFDNSEAFHTC